jgi:sugar diacid utilization regulator
MRMAENKLNFLDSLLEGAEISAEIVSRYLERTKWKLDSDFCFLSLTCPVDLTKPFESISYVKQINAIFPLAQVSVYRNSIIMILRCADYNIRRDKERRQLEKLLAKNDMRCGVSMVFHNFMRLRYYYAQSSFAAACCESRPDTLLCYYETCQRDHVLRSLASVTDPRAFCHPEILALWESGIEEQQELVRCLYYYLLNGKNLAATAKALFIHRNTLIYRLEKLSSILGNDLKNLTSEQVFFYLFSCFIVRYGLS